MSWEAKFENFKKFAEKELIEEPGLDLPVIEQEIDTDDELEMLDSLIYDALLEEDVPSLPVIDPKVVQWIDRLEEYEENEEKSVSDPKVVQSIDMLEEYEESDSDAYVQQEPEREEERSAAAGKVNEGNIHVEREEERSVETGKVNEGHQCQRCDQCGGIFYFPVNLRRHKWRHFDSMEERITDLTRDRFKEYWEKLEDEKAREIFSIKDALLPENLEKDLCNDIIDAVSSRVEALGTEHRSKLLNSVVAFLLEPEAAKECPPFPSIRRTLDALSDLTYFRGTLNPEMQEIVFPDKISMIDIEEQGLQASFEFLVEHCLMKAWADDRERMASLLLEEEAAAEKQT